MATLSSKPVGSIVKVKVNGILTEFIIVQQGKPNSDLYDSSCAGTWLLMKNIYEKRNFEGKGEYDGRVTYYNCYYSSGLRTYLDITFYNMIDAKIRSGIKNVTIPCLANVKDPYIPSKYKITAKVFPLSPNELNFRSGVGVIQFANDGMPLQYFKTCTDDLNIKEAKRIAYYNGVPESWCTRNDAASNSQKVIVVYSDGSCKGFAQDQYTFGVRPAFILDSSKFAVESDGTLVQNVPPINPTSITVPETVNGGQSLTVSWGAASDPDGNLSGYRLHRKYNDTNWAQIYNGSNRSYTDNITFGKTTVQYRIDTYDSHNVSSSGYTTSPVRTIINNRPPTIDDTDRDLGTFSASAPSMNYVVNDADGGSVNVKIQLDDVQIKNFTVSLGASNTLTFSADEWRKLKNGKHIWRITATDNYQKTAVRTITFTKNVTVVEFTSSVMAADAMPTKAIMNIQGAFPAGCKLLIEICNNGNDASPTWQDVTQSVQTGKKIFFSNKTKTAASWGVKVHVKLERGTASGDCCITSIGGNFG